MCNPAMLQVVGLALSSSQQMQADRTQRRALQQQQDAIKKLTNPVAAPPRVSMRNDQISSGYQSTLLTGPSGVAPGSQNVGSNTLLGQ